jgi:hypothetical protein
MQNSNAADHIVIGLLHFKKCDVFLLHPLYYLQSKFVINVVKYHIDIF